jgi:hypothetical protein
MSAVPPNSRIAPIEVLCPQCRLRGNAETLRCPDCQEDLATLYRLRYAGRIDYNEALALASAGEDTAALVFLRRALDVEPDLGPAQALLAEISGRIEMDSEDSSDAATVVIEG